MNCTVLLFGGQGVGIKSILYTVPQKVYIMVYSPLINVHSVYSVKLDVRTFTEIADVHSLGYMVGHVTYDLAVHIISTQKYLTRISQSIILGSYYVFLTAEASIHHAGIYLLTTEAHGIHLWYAVVSIKVPRPDNTTGHSCCHKANQ